MGHYLYIGDTMATTQQIKMLLAKANEAGVKAKWVDFADLNNGQIDKELEHFKKLTNWDSTNKPTTKVNDIRFGMCAKIVAMQMGIDVIFGNTPKYASRVLSLYKSVEAAYQTVKTSKPQPDPHRMTDQEECADLEEI